MSHQFRKHYELEEARSLLKRLRVWVKRLRQARAGAMEAESEMEPLLASGADLGGELPGRWVRAVGVVQEVLSEFESREIQVKDLERGLIDFPALRDGREVFLCWEVDEADIGYWHDIEAGYAGRQPL